MRGGTPGDLAAAGRRRSRDLVGCPGWKYCAAVDQHRRLFSEPIPKRRRSFRETIRERPRLTLLVGYGLLLLGSVLPWMRVWLPYRGFIDVSGFERAGDAGLLIELGLVGLALTWNESAWRSRITILVAGPLALAIVAAVLLRTANGDANIYLASLKLQGGYGSISPGFWAANAGAAIAIIGGAVHLRQRRGSVSFKTGLTWTTIAGWLGGAIGAGAGFLAGTEVASMVTAGALVAVSSSLVVFSAILFTVVGGWLGAVGASRLAGSLQRP